MSTAETKTVTLAGQEYEVPPVTFRNAARIHPLVERAFAAVRERKDASSVLEEETYLQLGRIVYYGIVKPDGMTEESFLDLIIPPHEMTNAALIVAQQAGMVASPGEAAGGEQPPTDFDELTAFVVMATGWTWDYAWETMTFQKLEAFGRAWKRNPPPHISVSQINFMLKSYFGVTDKGNEPAAEPILPGFMTQPDIEE